jgi:hypothetical protein
MIRRPNRPHRPDPPHAVPLPGCMGTVGSQTKRGVGPVSTRAQQPQLSQTRRTDSKLCRRYPVNGLGPMSTRAQLMPRCPTCRTCANASTPNPSSIAALPVPKPQGGLRELQRSADDASVRGVAAADGDRNEEPSMQTNYNYYKSFADRRETGVSPCSSADASVCGVTVASPVLARGP